MKWWKVSMNQATFDPMLHSDAYLWVCLGKCSAPDQTNFEAETQMQICINPFIMMQAVVNPSFLLAVAAQSPVAVSGTFTGWRCMRMSLSDSKNISKSIIYNDIKRLIVYSCG
jgi:hypothetical protein